MRSYAELSDTPKCATNEDIIRLLAVFGTPARGKSDLCYRRDWRSKLNVTTSNFTSAETEGEVST